MPEQLNYLVQTHIFQHKHQQMFLQLLLGFHGRRLLGNVHFQHTFKTSDYSTPENLVNAIYQHYNELRISEYLLVRAVSNAIRGLRVFYVLPTFELVKRFVDERYTKRTGTRLEHDTQTKG